VCPPGIEIQECAIVHLAGHVLTVGPKPSMKTDPGLGKLIDAVDVLIKPAADGMVFDAARLQRIAAAFLAKDSVPVARGDKKMIDVRSLVTEVDVIAGEAATALAQALDWGDAPALVRARVRATSEGSAKPSELARALGVWGSEDPRGEHALVARLGVVEGETAPIRVPQPAGPHPTATV
jgi:hypothetical protein